MHMRVGVIAAVALVAVLGVVAWVNNREHPQSAAPPEPEAAATAPEAGGPAPQVAAPAASDPGIAWDVPKGWLAQIESGMRLATYIVPGAAKGDDAECAVHYFGPGAGGGVEMNLDRWTTEFESQQKKRIDRREIAGMKVAVLAMTGTFAGHSMRTDTGAPGPRKDWGLLGAIVQGPQGDVFFKLTGPAATVDAAAKPFDAMLGSLRKK